MIFSRRSLLKALVGAASTPLLGSLPARAAVVVAPAIPVVVPPVLAPFSAPELWIRANKIVNLVDRAKIMYYCGAYGGFYKLTSHPMYEQAMDAQRDLLITMGKVIRFSKNNTAYKEAADAFGKRWPKEEMEKLVGMELHPAGRPIFDEYES